MSRRSAHGMLSVSCDEQRCTMEAMAACLCREPQFLLRATSPLEGATDVCQLGKNECCDSVESYIRGLLSGEAHLANGPVVPRGPLLECSAVGGDVRSLLVSAALEVGSSRIQSICDAHITTGRVDWSNARFFMEEADVARVLPREGGRPTSSARRVRQGCSPTGPAKEEPLARNVYPRPHATAT